MLSVTVQLRDLANNPRAIRNETSIDNIVLAYRRGSEDAALDNFSIAVDDDGFRMADHPDIQDETFDLLPMIRELLAFEAAQREQQFRSSKQTAGKTLFPKQPPGISNYATR